jgi:hypothetical protein
LWITSSQNSQKGRDHYDVIIALAAYCSREGLDLQSCVRDTWGHVSKRDWKTNPESGDAARQAEEGEALKPRE